MRKLSITEAELKKSVAYKKVCIPKDLVSTFSDKDLFLNFSICFLRLILCIQILMYRNFGFLLKSVVVIGVLLVFV